VELAASLTRQLNRVRQGAAQFLEEKQPEPAVPTAAGSDRLDPSALANLLALLRQQKLSALECFAAISPQLLRLLGKASHDRVRSYLDNLQFQEAATVLEAGRQ